MVRVKLSRFVLLLAAVVVPLVAAACTRDENPPTSATVIIEASADLPLLLIVSTRFEVVASGEFVYTNQDTIQITEDYNETFALNSEARFTAILKNDNEEVEGVRMSVLIEDRLEYDETASLGQGGFLQYVYRFQSGGIF